MKRRKSELPMRVYEYGVGEPTSGGDLLNQQMWLSHQHKNALIEIWRMKRAALRKERTALLPIEAEIEVLKARQKELRDSIGRKRSSARKRVPVPAEIGAELEAVKADLAVKYEQIKEAKGPLWSDPAFRRAVDRIETDHRQRVRDCQHEFTKGIPEHCDDLAVLRSIKASQDKLNETIQQHLASLASLPGIVDGQREFAANFQKDIGDLAAIRGLKDVDKEIDRKQRRLKDCQSGCPKQQTPIEGCQHFDCAKRHGLYWSTYNADEKDLSDGFKLLPLGEDSDPKFRRWDGSGRVAVQIQGGLAVENLFKTSAAKSDGQIEIDPIPDDTFDKDDQEHWKKTRGERRRATRTKVRFRVASDEKNHPIWVELPMVLHRPLPPGGVIKEAVLIRRRVACHHYTVLQIKVEANYRTMRSHGEGTIALDLGWRSGNQLRIGYWYDGKNGDEKLLPPDIQRNIEHVESLRSTRDDNFNNTKEWFAAWRMKKGIPEWLTSMTARLTTWKSPGRLAKVALVWRGQRFDGDDGGYERLEAWRKQDKHLWEWEANERKKTIGHRREEYRCFALWLFKNYSCVVLEDFDLRRVAALRQPEEKEKEPHRKARHNRVIAAVSVLRLAIKNAAISCGGTVKLVPPEYTTLMCHVCGFTEKWDTAAKVMHTCSNCGATWDQDYNGAVNLYNRAIDGDTVDRPTPTDAEAPPAMIPENDSASVEEMNQIR